MDTVRDYIKKLLLILQNANLYANPRRLSHFASNVNEKITVTDRRTDGRTDGRTDRITMTKTVQRIASHSKNCSLTKC